MAVYTLPPGEKGQFAVVPEGAYKLQIQDPKIAYARGSGAPTIECYLAVLEGQYTGERVYHQYSLEPTALWRIRDDLRTLGKLPRDKYPTDSPIPLEDTVMVQLLNSAIGYGAIFLDTYKGSPRSKLATEGFLTPDELVQRGITPIPTPPPPTPEPAPTTPPATPPAPAPTPEAREPF